MNKIDLIIDALEESLKDFATDSYGYDYRSCCGADLERGEHGDDCHLLKALAAARELKALQPVGVFEYDAENQVWEELTPNCEGVKLYALDDVTP